MKNRLNPEDQLERAEVSDRRPKRVWIWRLKGSEQGSLIIYSPKLWGVKVHWDQKKRRTQPHFKDSKRCPGCARDLPTKALFYLFGQHVEARKQVFLEMPHGAAEHLETLLAAGETFRGLALWIKRTSADNGRLQFRFVEQLTPKEKLPRDKDPHDTLMAIWDITVDDPRGGLEFPTSSNGFLEQEAAK